MPNPTERNEIETQTGYDSAGDVRTGRPPLANEAERIRQNAEHEAANKLSPEEEEARNLEADDEPLLTDETDEPLGEEVEEIDIENPDENPGP
jgi:hypothetical protein